MAQLRYLPLPNFYCHLNPNRVTPPLPNYNNLTLSSSSLPSSSAPYLRISSLPTNQFNPPKSYIPCATVAGGDGGSGGWSGGGGGGGGHDDSSSSDDNSCSSDELGPIGAFLNGWRSRVAADPQFPFKVLEGF